MTKKEFAEMLNGREIGEEMSTDDDNLANENGFVVIFGASDDLMELRGVIEDEVNCYDGGTAYFAKGDLLTNECCYEDCPHFEKMKEKAIRINAVWGENGYSWVYDVGALPHATFDIMEEGETYCQGVVVDAKDLV